MNTQDSGADARKGGRHLLVAGITPFTTIDWPRKLACVAFLAGCPWDCPYCQNPQLRLAAAASQTEEDLFAFLEKRRGLLDGVVFSGGEPLAQSAIVDAAQTVRELGFAVGLHTCGAYPSRLRVLLPQLDWVGLDIKTPWHAYDRITRREGSGERARESLEILLASGIDFETRTTWHPALLSPADIEAIGRDLAAKGVRSWAIQAYRSQGTTGELPDETVYPSDMPKAVAELFESFEFRRA